MLKTIDWYKQYLSCNVFFTYGEPVNYAVLSLNDHQRIHITEKDDNFRPSDRHTAIYVFVHNIDKVFDHMKAHGLVTGTLETADFGMRDFTVTDLNGYHITFGQSSS